MKTVSFLRLALFTIIISLLYGPSVYAQWEFDRRLTYNDSDSRTSWNNVPCIASSPGEVSRTLHVVWYDFRDGPSEIYYKRSTDCGLTWSQDTRLTYVSGWRELPGVSASGTDVHVVWRDARDSSGTCNIYYKHSTDNGTTWSPDIPLTTDTTGYFIPSVSACDSTVYVVWIRFVEFPGVYYKRSTDRGMTWSQSIRLASDSAGPYDASVWAFGPNVHVVWDDCSGRAGGQIYYKTSTDWGMTWSPAVRLCNDSVNAGDPSICAWGSDIHVVWIDDRYNPRNGGVDVAYRRSTDNGKTWSRDTAFTHHPPQSSAAFFPSVAAFGSNVHVIWEDSRDWPPRTNEEIYYKQSTDRGATWSGDVRLTFDPALSGWPSLALTDTMVHVVWTDWRNYPNDGEIYYKRNPTGRLGIREDFEKGPRKVEVRFKAIPNPFVSFTTIPGREGERFALYDIAGRRVGTYKGDRIAEGVAPGVYFLRPEGRNERPLRIVKAK